MAQAVNVYFRSQGGTNHNVLKFPIVVKAINENIEVIHKACLVNSKQVGVLMDKIVWIDCDLFEAIKGATKHLKGVIENGNMMPMYVEMTIGRPDFYFKANSSVEIDAPVKKVVKPKKLAKKVKNDQESESQL